MPPPPLAAVLPLIVLRLTVRLPPRNMAPLSCRRIAPPSSPAVLPVIVLPVMVIADIAAGGDRAAMSSRRIAADRAIDHVQDAESGTNRSAVVG